MYTHTHTYIYIYIYIIYTYIYIYIHIYLCVNIYMQHGDAPLNPAKVCISRVIPISSCASPATSRATSCVLCCTMLQCVAVCCSVLQCVAVCCSVLHCHSVSQCVEVCCSASISLTHCAVCCTVLQCVHLSRHIDLYYCFFYVLSHKGRYILPPYTSVSHMYRCRV